MILNFLYQLRNLFVTQTRRYFLVACSQMYGMKFGHFFSIIIHFTQELLIEKRLKRRKHKNTQTSTIEGKLNLGSASVCSALKTVSRKVH